MADATEVIAGIDIGHSKIAVAVGKSSGDGVSFIGAGSSPSKGLRRGSINNMESLLESIQEAVHKAHEICGASIDSVYAALPGSDMRSIRSHGICSIKGSEVTCKDVERALDAAMSPSAPLDREFIHIIPQEYRLDDQEEIENPIGMFGCSLEAMTFTVTAPVALSQRVVKCCKQAGLTVKDIVLNQLASSEAVLTGDEKKSGVVMIDIGSEFTKMAFFIRGFPANAWDLSLGSVHISNDIAIGLRISPQQGEEVKKKYGCALKSLITPGETVDVPDFNGKGPRTFPREELTEIIQKRAREILLSAREELTKYGVEAQALSCVVLTGGGSLLKGLPELASGIFERSVRVGTPQGLSGLTQQPLDPTYAAAVGLVLRGFSQVKQ